MTKKKHMETHEQSPWYLAQCPCGATFRSHDCAFPLLVRIRRSPAAGKKLEKGTALIASLLLLLVLTVLALSLMNTSTFEIGISGNEKTSLEAFYAAEAGIQMALNRLPSMESIPLTTIGSDSHCWSGSLSDRGNPTELGSLGLAFQSGNDLSEFGFRRILIHVTGESQGAVRELEVQVKENRPISPTTGH